MVPYTKIVAVFEVMNLIREPKSVCESVWVCVFVKKIDYSNLQRAIRFYHKIVDLYQSFDQIRHPELRVCVCAHDGFKTECTRRIKFGLSHLTEKL